MADSTADSTQPLWNWIRVSFFGTWLLPDLISVLPSKRNFAKRLSQMLLCTNLENLGVEKGMPCFSTKRVSLCVTPKSTKAPCENSSSDHFLTIPVSKVSFTTLPCRSSSKSKHWKKHLLLTTTLVWSSRHLLHTLVIRHAEPVVSLVLPGVGGQKGGAVPGVRGVVSLKCDNQRNVQMKRAVLFWECRQIFQFLRSFLRWSCSELWGVCFARTRKVGWTWGRSSLSQNSLGHPRLFSSRMGGGGWTASAWSLWLAGWGQHCQNQRSLHPWLYLLKWVFSEGIFTHHISDERLHKFLVWWQSFEGLSINQKFKKG